MTRKRGKAVQNKEASQDNASRDSKTTAKKRKIDEPLETKELAVDKPKEAQQLPVKIETKSQARKGRAKQAGSAANHASDEHVEEEKQSDEVPKHDVDLSDVKEQPPVKVETKTQTGRGRSKQASSTAKHALDEEKQSDEVPKHEIEPADEVDAQAQGSAKLTKSKLQQKKLKGSKDIIGKSDESQSKDLEEQVEREADAKPVAAKGKGRKKAVEKNDKTQSKGSELQAKSDPDDAESVGVKDEHVLKSKTVSSAVIKLVPVKAEVIDERESSEIEKGFVQQNDLDVKTESISVARVATGKKYIGAHVSIAGGLWNAITATQQMGGTAFGLFLKSQRTWNSKPLVSEDAELFKKTLKEADISPWMVVPHGSYLLNCGSADAEILRKSRDNLLDELQRCEKLGLPIYNFHPGSSKGRDSRDDCIRTIAETINYVHSKTKTVITVIENMSGQGNTIGGSFAELRAIIDLVNDKSRVGVCLDTCHAFAAGYDIKSDEGYEKMKEEFDKVIGRKYLLAIHLNDSKGELGCNLDRHENIGKGKLGLKTFNRLMNDPFFDDVPMVLETPECDYSREIKLLYQQQNKK